MKKNFAYLPKSSSLLLVAMASAGAFAAPVGQIYLEDNEMVISKTSSTPSFSQTVSISSAGLIDTIADVPSTNGVGIPSFEFDILKAGANPPVGVYQFGIGVVIDDQNSSRQMEAYIGNLRLTVAANGNIGGSIPAQSMELRGRDGSGNLEVTVTVPNASANGPVKVSGNKVTFDAEALLDKLKTNTVFSNVILEEFDDETTYDFRIIAKQISGAGLGGELAFGTYADASFTSFQTAATNGSTEPVFALSPSAIAVDKQSPYYVKGSFNVVYVAPSSGGGDTGGGGTPTVDTDADADELDNAVDDILNDLNDIADGEEIPDAVLDAINDNLNSGATLADNAASQAATLTPDAAKKAFESINKSLAAAGSVTSKGGTVNTDSATSTLDKVASALSAMNSADKLSSEEVGAIVTSTLTNASNLVGTGAKTADILKVVKASSNILLQAANAATKSGAPIPETVVTQAKALATKAVGGVLANLGISVSNVAEAKAAMQSNPSVLSVALAASAALPNDAKISIGGVDFTREDLVKAGLEAGLTAGGLTGGLNFQSATAGFTVTTDSVSGNMTLTNGEETYVAASPVSRLVPDTVPEGINYLPNGTAVLTSNGVSTELAPTAFDSAGFTSTVSTAGFQLTYRDNGSISIDLGNNERFSGAFAFDNLASASSCGAMSITSPTGNPAAADYAFIVNCANGPSQRVTPFADSTVFYSVVSDSGLNIRTDRNTGIITIDTVGRFKPSFFVTPLSLNDTVYYDANKNAEGIAFRASDKNGDGKTDYEVISADGVQVLYGL